MIYTCKNYKTKKAVKDAIAAGELVECYQPNGDLTGAGVPQDGQVFLEGPHYPEPHRWYGEGVMQAGVLVKIK